MVERSYERCFSGASVAVGFGLLTACGGPKESPRMVQHLSDTRAAQPSPGVTEVVRHYADLMARGARLTTTASRQLAGSQAVITADSQSFYLSFATCYVEAELNRQQRLTAVSVAESESASVVPKAIDFSIPKVERLVRLGDLRRAFGPGKLGIASMTLAKATRRFPVEFIYQPAPTSQPVQISATMPVPSYADSSKVHSINMYSAEYE
jgi:hypothetical protein